VGCACIDVSDALCGLDVPIADHARPFYDLLSGSNFTWRTQRTESRRSERASTGSQLARTIRNGADTFLIYEPQVETWEDNRINLYLRLTAEFHYEALRTHSINKEQNQ
jgi:hypothetical protein